MIAPTLLVGLGGTGSKIVCLSYERGRDSAGEV